MVLACMQQYCIRHWLEAYVRYSFSIEELVSAVIFQEEFAGYLRLSAG